MCSADFKSEYEDHLLNKRQTSLHFENLSHEEASRKGTPIDPETKPYYGKGYRRFWSMVKCISPGGSHMSSSFNPNPTPEEVIEEIRGGLYFDFEAQEKKELDRLWVQELMLSNTFDLDENGKKRFYVPYRDLNGKPIPYPNPFKPNSQS